KKGMDIVEMNHKAIDAGATAFVKIDVPADWATAADDAAPAKEQGPAKLVKMVDDIMKPVGKMDGDSLPVSAFVDHVDGTFEQGASAYEKRGVAVMVPEWNAETCAKCNQCAFVCPHATIRPFGLTEEEVAAAPDNMKVAPKPIIKTHYTYTLAVSPMDCMGCGVCVGVCPTKSLKMVSRESQEDQQVVFDYCVEKVAPKKDIEANTVIGSQYKQPLLEFSGSCAGCAETAYARLITQICGDRMYISNATGCSSIWGGPAATSPYTTDKNGRGPAWANSLFEDNAEHGFGMYLGQKAIRNRLIDKVQLIADGEKAPATVKAACEAYLNTLNDGPANDEATKVLVAELEKLDCDCEARKDILDNKEYLSKKSIWIFGGDGWAYDIGFGGLDHVLASGEDVNIMVFDTEVYSNTGGQASKASQIGQVAQFAAAGKAIAKKSLAEIAMSYGYVYVAQIAMGANMNQTIKAIAEAEAYPGPSLIIGYAPCEMHSIKGGMVNCQAEMKKAVECGYWHMFRFNPALKAEGKNPFTLDSKAPTGSYRDFIMNEARYSSLTRSFPDRAEELFAKAEANATARYEHLLRLGELYGMK
ncbi:MAG: 4Fe-4S binding protein, partial [Clostridia bacterium]|nr:4Fe-4S binding protein [Clostridia bacterium]